MRSNMSLRAVLVLSVAVALLPAAVQAAPAGWLNEYTYEGKTIDVFTLDPWTGAPAGVTPTTTSWSTGWTVPTGVTSVDVLVVAGGGAGGAYAGDGGCGGGGGAGGMIYKPGFAVSSGPIELTVGAGGTTLGMSGINSVFGTTLTAIGGGSGALNSGPGLPGGSGGGAGSTYSTAPGGAGTDGQGNNGAPGMGGWDTPCGGGGGAGHVGGYPYPGDYWYNANGGDGLPCWISGSEVWYAGGGGGTTSWDGGPVSPYGGKAGKGGGGFGGGWGRPYTSGTANTGGGGGGGGGGRGGSGIVIVSYVISVIPGDTNDDGVVDAADYITLKQNFGTTGGWAQGNFDETGTVDWADLSTLTANMGSGGPAPATTPEPATLGLLAIGALAVIRRRRS